jgi:hypothetical protein
MTAAVTALVFNPHEELIAGVRAAAHIATCAKQLARTLAQFKTSAAKQASPAVLLSSYWPPSNLTA